MELFNENSRLVNIINIDFSLLPVINRLGVKLGIGDLSIKQLCDKEGVDINFFIEIINVFHNENYFPEKKLLNFSSTIVIEYLLNTHKYYLEYFIPEIDRLIELFLTNCESGCEENILIQKFYNKFRADFIKHIDKEEQFVFPYILQLSLLEKGLFDKDSFIHENKDSNIKKFEKDHSNMEDKMFDLKNIIIKYLPPNYNLNIGNALLTNLFLFEKDLKNHSRIEDKILFQRVKPIEKAFHLNHD